MSFGFRLVLSIPYETSLAAHQIYNFQDIYLQIGDNLERIYTQIDLALLDPSSISSGDVVFRLALANAFQYSELLPDPLAANATLKRIDWKYALYLPVNHPGIKSVDFCNFRQTIYSSEKALNEYGFLLNILAEYGFFTQLCIQSRDPKTILSVICQVNRLHLVHEKMKASLGLLSSEASEWLISYVSPHWYERYKTGWLERVDYFNSSAIQTYANRMGADIATVLSAVKEKGSDELNDKAEIRNLTSLFQQQYLLQDDIIQWRNPGCVSCACNNLFSEGGGL